jgi:hypothetical protein
MLVRWTPSGFVKIEQPQSRVAVVCFANGRYVESSKRMVESFQKWSPRVDVMVYDSFEQIGSPTQKENPYAFKVYAIESAIQQGYTTVLWCDSVLTLTRPIEDLVKEVRQHGVYLAQDGWKTGQFANDRALAYYGVTRDEAMEIPAIWACFMGFDFTQPVAREFFARWKLACKDGIFHGLWRNIEQTESADPRCKGHRHDQSCAELLSYKMGIPRAPAVLHPDPDYPHRYFRGREW